MNNVEKVKAGELAIFNDNKEATIKCVSHCWPKDQQSTGGNTFYFKQKNNGERWDCASETNLPTVLATVLLSEIEGKTQLTKEEAVRFIKNAEMSIKNDNLEATQKCANIIWPSDGCTIRPEHTFVYQLGTGKNWAWDNEHNYDKIIPATELLKLLESETVEAWSPKVGEEYEFSNNELVFERGELLGIINHEYKYIVKVLGSNHPIPHINCRPLPKQLTRIEAEALLSELKGETYKIVD